MTKICLQAGHENIESNCDALLAQGTGAPGERQWTPIVRGQVAQLLRAHGLTVDEIDANANCAPNHPAYDLTLAIHYQANTGHSGFGCFAPDPDLDRDNPRSLALMDFVRHVYAAKTGLPDYSDPRLTGGGPTWDNVNTRRYYLWATQNGPCGLIECGEGATGAPDNGLLWAETGVIVEAIAEGIVRAFGLVWAPPPAPSPLPKPEPQYLFAFTTEPASDLHPADGVMPLSGALQLANEYIAMHPGSAVTISTKAA